MIRIFIQGLADGEHQIDLIVASNTIADLSPEYDGEIQIKGQMLIHHKRYALAVNVRGLAKLICDLSLKEFEEEISFEYKSSYISDSSKYLEQNGRELKENEERAIPDDEKYLDITDEIRDELAVNLPMKRVIPELRDKEFEELYPQYSNKKNQVTKKDTEIDDRWSPLKNIKLN